MEGIVLHITYKGMNGSAEAFIREAAKSGLQEEIRKEAGCLRYDYYLPLEGGETVFLLEVWENEEALKAHAVSPGMEKLKKLKEKYGVETIKE